MSTFADLGVSAEIIRTLARRDITEPFPIQSAVIADGLAGRDVSGRAPTGSGKTLGFGIPLIQRVGQGRPKRPRGLVLAPTRELAEQIATELRPLAKAEGRFLTVIYGGVGYGPQRQAMKRGVDIVIATPGRLADLIGEGTIDLRDVDIVVLDEADRMSDMGFLPEVRRLLDQTADNRQTVMFSATLDGDVAAIRRDYQRDPVLHETEGVDAEAGDVEHHFWLVDHHDRVAHTADVIDEQGSTIVFTRTRHGADRLAKQLGRYGVNAVAMHGGRSQNQRNRALKDFTTGRAAALVATDVAARGIHVDDVAAVVHYDPPADEKDYTHRSGRTARAGATGTVVSLVTREKRKTVLRMQQDLGLDEPIRTRRPGSEERPAAEHPTPAERSRDEHQSVYIANLPWKATDADVAALFGRYGKVSQATVMMDRRTQRSRGFGFVDMHRKADAEQAIAALNGSEMNGRDLTVRFAKPRG